MLSPEKEEEEKPQKKKKRKRTAPQAWRSGPRFCRRKLCLQGVIFDGQTAQPPDLDGPMETGYLCGLFVFLNGDYKV